MGTVAYIVYMYRTTHTHIHTFTLHTHTHTHIYIYIHCREIFSYGDMTVLSQMNIIQSQKKKDTLYTYIAPHEKKVKHTTVMHI